MHASFLVNANLASLIDIARFVITLEENNIANDDSNHLGVSDAFLKSSSIIVGYVGRSKYKQIHGKNGSQFDLLELIIIDDSNFDEPLRRNLKGNDNNAEQGLQKPSDCWRFKFQQWKAHNQGPDYLRFHSSPGSLVLIFDFSVIIPAPSSQEIILKDGQMLPISLGSEEAVALELTCPKVYHKLIIMSVLEKRLALIRHELPSLFVNCFHEALHQNALCKLVMMLEFDAPSINQIIKGSPPQGVIVSDSTGSKASLIFPNLSSLEELRRILIKTMAGAHLNTNKAKSVAMDSIRLVCHGLLIVRAYNGIIKQIRPSDSVYFKQSQEHLAVRDSSRRRVSDRLFDTSSFLLTQDMPTNALPWSELLQLYCDPDLLMRKQGCQFWVESSLEEIFIADSDLGFPALQSWQQLISVIRSPPLPNTLHENIEKQKAGSLGPGSKTEVVEQEVQVYYKDSVFVLGSPHVAQENRLSSTSTVDIAAACTHHSTIQESLHRTQSVSAASILLSQVAYSHRTSLHQSVSPVQPSCQSLAVVVHDFVWQQIFCGVPAAWALLSYHQNMDTFCDFTVVCREVVEGLLEMAAECKTNVAAAGKRKRDTSSSCWFLVEVHSVADEHGTTIAGDGLLTLQDMRFKID